MKLEIFLSLGSRKAIITSISQDVGVQLDESEIEIKDLSDIANVGLLQHEF